MEKLNLITRNTSEIVTLRELEKIIVKPKPRAYIGFEPSGVVHIGWLICTNKIRDFLSCGFEFTILLADWHAYINDKLGGDIEKIRLCGRYLEDCFAAMGVEKNKVSFVYASDYVNDPNYWELVLKVSKSVSVARVKRAMDIMGRKQEEAEKDLSKLFYPAMQVADIFYLKVDVTYGGMDQRHAHMLARDVSYKLNRNTPVAVHTPIITGLQASGRMNALSNKMSKSKPESIISIHDPPETVNKKIRKAYCPEKTTEGNPVLEICKYIIFPEIKNEGFIVERPEKFGGDIDFHSYEELEKAFMTNLHPLDLKSAVSKYLNSILDPIREYFEKKPDNYRKMVEIGIIPSTTFD